MTVTTAPLSSEEVRARERAMASVCGVRNAADCALVDIVVEALEEGWWSGWGVHTPTQWLMLRAGIDRRTANQVLRLARRAAELPTVMAAFRRGALSLDQAATVARFTPAAYEASVCELALSATVHQIRSATKHYAWDAEVIDRDEPVRTGPERSVSFGSDTGDQWRASIKLPADEGAVVEAALRATRDRLHDLERAAAKTRAVDEGRATTGTDAELGVPQISWADAVVGMARSVLTSGADGAEVAARTGVLLHLQAPVGDVDGWRAEMHMGPALPPALRRYLTCDCDIAVVWHTEGRPVQVGRAHRVVPRRIRRLVEHRDGGCRVPGCDRTAHVEVHHITHWEDHGDTVTWNLICLCSHHHRQHHHGLLGITGNADQPHGVIFTTATGAVIRPPDPPPQPAEMPTAQPYAGPTGERLNRHHVWFSRRRPERHRQPAA